MGEIVIAGNGKIGKVCLAALQKKFERVDIVKADNPELINMKREQDKIVEQIDDSFAVYVFLAGWYPLIRREALKEKHYINIHGSLLPKYRGFHSIFWAIMNGEDQLGYTIHEVNERVDDGDILYQYRFPYIGQTVAEVHNNFYKDLDKNLGRVVADYMDGMRSGNVRLYPQDRSKATWVPRRNLDDCLVDFNMPNYMLRRFFKALTAPYPLPRIRYKQTLYEITDSEIIDVDYYCQIGRAVASEEDGVFIKVKDGWLVVKSLREADMGRKVRACDVIKSGYRFVP